VTSWARVGIGLALLWGALGVLGYRLGWQLHSHRGQQALVTSARAAEGHGGTCTSGTPASDGQLAGVLDIPSLQVTGPVEQGTTDDVLNVAIGHADGTPWPGDPGTAVLLAHDVSYFANIGQLKAGDVIRYEHGCTTDVFTVTGHDVVKAGAPVPQLAGNALVLDTCWPTNALWYTPNRYLVEAVETSVERSVGSSVANPGANPPAGPATYTTPAPPELLAQGLDLEHNEEPMGTMTLAGSPSAAWAQSPAPLAVEAGALQAFFGGVHSLSQQRSDWWALLAPGVPMPAPLVGARVTGHDAPLDVTITADGDQPSGVELDTVVTVSGGTAPGTYHEKVTEAVHGQQIVITGWEVDHG